MTTLPDPRPATTPGDADTPDEVGLTVPGRRCEACGLATLSGAPTCPACGGVLSPTEFGPTGAVWSSTVVRVGVPERTPPYALAYVDLDDGPRVLAHVPGLDERIPIGTRVHVSGHTPDGDLAVAVGSGDGGTR